MIYMALQAAKWYLYNSEFLSYHCQLGGSAVLPSTQLPPKLQAILSSIYVFQLNSFN